MWGWCDGSVMREGGLFLAQDDDDGVGAGVGGAMGKSSMVGEMGDYCSHDAPQTGNSLMFLYRICKNICRNLHDISWRCHTLNFPDGEKV